MKRTWSYLVGFALLVLPVVSAIAQADTPAVCLIGDHPGIPESDAQTAALLVCDELHKQGISITDPVYEAPTTANAYRVVLRRLGEKIIVRLSHEKPIGTIITEQQVTLANIEEIIPAAHRLVDALVHDKPINDTVDMETVVEQEARELRKISGESLWHLTIFGAFVPGTEVAGDPGFEIGWSKERPSYAVETEVGVTQRLKFYDSDDFSLMFWSIGGRYFFNKQNISPYIGGGGSRITVNYGRESYGYRDEELGLGIYGVVGIEALRFTESRLNLELRIDRPLFKLPSQDIMPITFGISFSRNYVPGGCLF